MESIIKKITETEEGYEVQLGDFEFYRLMMNSEEYTKEVYKKCEECEEFSENNRREELRTKFKNICNVFNDKNVDSREFFDTLNSFLFDDVDTNSNIVFIERGKQFIFLLSVYRKFKDITIDTMNLSNLLQDIKDINNEELNNVSREFLIPLGINEDFTFNKEDNKRLSIEQFTFRTMEIKRILEL